MPMITPQMWNQRLRLSKIQEKSTQSKESLFGGRGIPIFIVFLVILGASTTPLADSSPINQATLSGNPPACTIPFLVEETLVFPTKESVSFTSIPAISTTIYLEYGPSPARLSKKTPTMSVNGGETAAFVMDGLSPGKKYYYRVRCTNPGNPRPGTKETHSFSTLAREGESFTFLYGTDSHYYELWGNETFGSAGGLDTFHLSLDHMFEDIAQEGALFHIIGGDWAQTSCGGCKGGTLDGETYPPGSVQNEATAKQRYIQTLDATAYGRVTKDMPLVYVLGNHEGEAGFDQEEMAHSLAGRKSVLPDAPASYASNAEDSYYYFDSGDARFIILDVMRYTPIVPQSANDWTLGTIQLEWLERILQSNEKKWVFIFAEHLDGGEKAYGVGGNQSWYGRGGLRATDTDLPTGVFKGEQSIIQALQETHLSPGGASFFLSGHDHVAIIPTEKPNDQGEGTRTYHVKGGRMGGVGFGWTTDAAFKKEMDWDLDTITDYEDLETGTKKPGYYRITVNGKESVVFEYIQSDKNDPTLDGTVAFTKIVYAEE